MLSGPEIVVPAPPLVAAPTGLLRSATVINMPVATDLPNIYSGRNPDGSWRIEPSGGIGGRPPADLASGEHWLAGTRFSPEAATAPVLRDACNGNWYRLGPSGTATLNTTGARTFANTRLPVRAQSVFEVEVEDTCSDLGYLADDYQDRAVRALLVKEQNAVESEFEVPLLNPQSRGLSDGSRDITATTNSTTTVTSGSFLAADVGQIFQGSGIPAGTTIVSVVPATSAVLSTAATSSVTGGTFTVGSTVILNGGTSVTANVAFALLQEAIARADIGQGMVHSTAFLAERWAENHALRFDATGKLTSANGNLVVAGNGYQGIGPDGTGGDVNPQGATPIQWAYATDIVRVRRAEVPVVYPGVNDWREALDRPSSTITFWAARPYVIEWAALAHFAVKVAVLT